VSANVAVISQKHAFSLARACWNSILGIRNSGQNVGNLKSSHEKENRRKQKEDAVSGKKSGALKYCPRAG
jgi:hypothetical protein